MHHRTCTIEHARVHRSRALVLRALVIMCIWHARFSACACPVRLCLCVLLSGGGGCSNTFYYKCPRHKMNYVLSFVFEFDLEDDVYYFAYWSCHTLRVLLTHAVTARGLLSLPVLCTKRDLLTWQERPIWKATWAAMLCKATLAAKQRGLLSFAVPGPCSCQRTP